MFIQAIKQVFQAGAIGYVYSDRVEGGNEEDGGDFRLSAATQRWGSAAAKGARYSWHSKK